MMEPPSDVVALRQSGYGTCAKQEPKMIKATPFDFPYDGRLVPQNTALVVIDLQEDFLSTIGLFRQAGV